MFDVITIGSATIDLFLSSEAEVITVKTHFHEQEMIAYPAGKKILVEHISHMTGGGATNTAVAFARLGLKTGCICKVGTDGYGDQIIQELKTEKIAFLGVQAKEETGCSVVLDSVKHDRTILVCKGVNNHLQMKEIKKNKLATKWFYVSALLGDSYKTCEELALFAEKNNIQIAFNPSNYLAEKGKAALHVLLSRTNVLLLNKEEAQALVHMPIDEPKNEIKNLLKECRRIIHADGMVVITDGKNGAYCYDGKMQYFIQPRQIQVIETTGAGDAFTSTFLAAYIKTKNIKSSLRLAQINAESVIQAFGAKNILLSWKEAMKQMTNYKHQIKTVKL